MPKITAIQTNFTGGEMSPRLMGRVDIDKYPNSVKKMRNALPLVHGGCTDRGGMKYIKSAKNADKLAVLIPFIYNNSQSYILEFGDLYMRVYTNGGQVEASAGVPYEIVTPYSESMLRDLSYDQSSDTMVIAHEKVSPRRLLRYGDNNWAIKTLGGISPFAENGLNVTVNITLASTAIANGVAVSGTSSPFMASDVGRQIIERNLLDSNGNITSPGTGIALITGYTDQNNVTVNITSAFTRSSQTVNGWYLDSSPQTTLTPSAKGPIGDTITLTMGAAGIRGNEYFFNPHVRINGGLVRLTTYVSSTVMSGVVIKELTSTTAAQKNAWSLELDVWSWQQTYNPRAVAFNEQRLLFAGSPGLPTTIWGSRTGEYFNFTSGTADDDGFSFKISKLQSQIMHLQDIRKLLAFSQSTIYSVVGGIEKPITPTNVQINTQTADGCNEVRPLRVGNEIIFVHRAGKKLLATSYDINVDGYNSTVVSKLAEHIAALGIVSMSYQRETDSIIWLVLGDGSFASVTLDREERVNAWALHSTDGFVESVATIPVESGEETWVTVRRVINGNNVRYVEKLDSTIKMDSAITGTSGSGANVWTGLSHLEGKSVAVVADGMVMGSFTVSGGQITLPRNANQVSIGLSYVPEIELLPIEFSSATGTAQGKQVRTGRTVIRLLETTGLEVDGKDLALREFGDSLLDQPLVPYTGDKDVQLLGWQKSGGSIVIRQPYPLAMHILAVIREVTVND